LRIKEQETCLTLQEHDNDDENVPFFVTTTDTVQWRIMVCRYRMVYSV
jgi:hypothetical protein